MRAKNNTSKKRTLRNHSLRSLLKSINLFTILTVLIGIQTHAQAPDAFKYQAVARDANGHVLANQSLSFRVSIISGFQQTVTYVEIHAVTSNAFGLVNLEIGKGTVESGDFSMLDWGGFEQLVPADHFIQLEMDASGGTDYQMMGTAQLLSVPFALHAKTAAKDSKKYQIGDEAQGGYIFHVDETGEHGLVAAPTDQSRDMQWYNGTYRITNATGDGVGAGEMNTMLIIAQQTQDNTVGMFAAKLCADLVINAGHNEVYGDWYLPSKYELNLMRARLFNREVGLDRGHYWSSTEIASFQDGDVAWFQFFGDGHQNGAVKNIKANVRAIRAF